MWRRIALATALIIALGVVAAAVALRDPDSPPTHESPAAPPASHRFGITAAHPGTVPLARSGAGWYVNYADEPDPRVHLEFVPIIFWQTDLQPVTASSIE